MATNDTEQNGLSDSSKSEAEDLTSVTGAEGKPNLSVWVKSLFQ